MAATGPTSFLSLPPEIRVQVYEICTSSCTPQTLREVLPLVQTCRTVRAEALEIFDNHGLAFPTINRLYAFLRAIGRARRARLERLAFYYAVASGDADGHAKWADIELVKRAFRLLQTECRALGTLTVHVSPVHMSRDLGSTWNMSPHWKFYRRTDNISETQGLLELSRLRGLREVAFVPYEGQPLTDPNQRELERARARMMAPRRMRKVPGSKP